MKEKITIISKPAQFIRVIMSPEGPNSMTEDAPFAVIEVGYVDDDFHPAVTALRESCNVIG